MTSTFATSVAVRLREAQEHAHLSNRELALQMGVSLDLVRRWRSGTRTPNEGHRARLACVLKCDLGEAL